MFSVKVNRVQLLDILKGNREKHQLEYIVAMRDFKSAVLRLLRKKIVDIEETLIDREEYLHFNLQFPFDYSKDYNEIIGMLELSNDTGVELDRRHYQCWVQDNWEWKSHWQETNMSYSSV